MAQEQELEDAYTEAFYPLPATVARTGNNALVPVNNKNRLSFVQRFASLIVQTRRRLFGTGKKKQKKTRTNTNNADESRYLSRSAPIETRYMQKSAPIPAYDDEATRTAEQLIEERYEDDAQNVSPTIQSQIPVEQRVENAIIVEQRVEGGDQYRKKAPVKKAPVPRKAAPSKSAAGGDPGNDVEAILTSAQSAVKQAPMLKSSAFSETRFSQAWHDWDTKVAMELTESAKRVEQDSKNGYAWTLTAKISRFTRGLVAGTDFEGKSFIEINELGQVDIPINVPIVSPLENASFSITHDPDLVNELTFRIHPSFVPHVIKQKSTSVSRVGWGSFLAAVDIHVPTSSGTVFSLRFDHYIVLKDHQVGVSESTYLLDLRGERFIVQVGNVYGMIDDPANPSAGDEVLVNIARSRGKRREHLLRTQTRLQEVRSAQREIDEFIDSCEEKQMALGAVVAAILNGRSITVESFRTLYEHGMKSLRCVVLDETNIPRFERYIRGGTALGSELDAFDISCDVPPGTVIDRFVSHSWFDDANVKCDTVLRWAKDFERRSGRPARIWLDKFCLKQTADDLSMSVPCLPIYLLRCDRVLLLRSDTFTSRLWCLTEIYTRDIMGEQVSGDNGIDEISLASKEKDGKPVSLAAARCSIKEDEDVLRTNLDRAPGGLSEVERVLNAALIIHDS